MRTSYGVGRYQAGEGDVIAMSPVAPKPRGCLFFGGYTQTAASVLTNADTERMVRALCDAGFRTMTADWSGSSHWGNDTAVARAETGRVYHQSVVADPKVVLVGVSMGSILALRYAMAQPSRVAAIALLTPIPDVQAQYDNNTGGFQSVIGTAYGGRPSNAQNPAGNIASFASIPMQTWYSTDDAVAPAARALSFMQATGKPATPIGAVGHALTGFSGVQMADWLAQYVT